MDPEDFVKTRPEWVDEFSGELFDYAKFKLDMYNINEHEERQDLLLDIFAKSIIWLFRSILALNPQLDADILVDQFAEDIRDGLDGWDHINTGFWKGDFEDPKSN